MKRFLLFAYVLILSIPAFSQTPQYVPYQAVARNAAGNLLVNQNVSLRFTIRETSGSGTVDYQETQSATTNSLGLFSVNIGNGTVVSGTFAGVPWGNGVAKYTQVEIDPTGGTSYTSMGAAQMMSVPYALYAGTASAAPLANPTSLIGMTANNGMAATGMRSDGTPAINAAIAPTWTGVHTFSNSTHSALFTGGNVGIGTATPAGILHVITPDFSGGSLTAWSTSQVVVGKTGTTGGGLGLSFDGTNSVGTIYSLAPSLAWQDLALRANNTIFYYGGGTEGMRLASTGNVGIGNSSPTYKLDVSGTERVTGALTVGGTASFSGTTYSALFSGGTVGIGTSTPDQALTVDGTTPIVEIKSGGYLQLRPTGNGWDMRLQATGQQLNILSGGNLSSPIMSLVNGGNVGIGTSAPAYPLDVEAFYTFTSGYSGYGALYSGGATYISGSSGTNTPVSIHTNYRMTANEFDAVSDKRIKDIIDISNPAADLATLGKLEVTDFKYKDRVAHGDNTKKGFIAQQVEEVYPEAINKMSDFIPDIYASSEACIFDKYKHSLTITMSKPHNLVAGNKVRIMNGAKSKEVTVSEIVSDVKFSVGDWNEPVENVFVFGKQVNDFRTVDYDRIYTLNVSATQELARQVKALQAENAELKCKNDELAAKNGAKADASELTLLKQQVEELKRIVETNVVRGEK